MPSALEKYRREQEALRGKFVESAKTEVEEKRERLREEERAWKERQRQLQRELNEAIDTLDEIEGRSPRRSRTASNGSGPRRRRGGGRAAEALKLVKERPGITIPQLAEAMGIKQNYLYRVMPSLAEDGKVTKSGRGWHPKD